VKCKQHTGTDHWITTKIKIPFNIEKIHCS